MNSQNKVITGLFREVVERDPLHPLFEQEKELLWRMRYSKVAHSQIMLRCNVIVLLWQIQMSGGAAHTLKVAKCSQVGQPQRCSTGNLICEYV